MALVPLNYYDLLELLPQPGCVICTLVERDTNRYLDSLLYEYANAPATHVRLRASRGLCADHSARLADFGAGVLGVTILQAQVLDEVRRVAEANGERTLSRLLRMSGGGAAVADRLEPTEECPACSSVNHAEEGHTNALANAITDERMLTAFRQSDGLCLPHLKMALRATPSPAHLEKLMTAQTEHWTRLREELETFMRAYDMNKTAPSDVGAASDSWRRALRLLAGRPR